jgi:hypothetical protein
LVYKTDRGVIIGTLWVNIIGGLEGSDSGPTKTERGGIAMRAGQKDVVFKAYDLA